MPVVCGSNPSSSRISRLPSSFYARLRRLMCQSWRLSYQVAEISPWLTLSVQIQGRERLALAYSGLSRTTPFEYIFTCAILTLLITSGRLSERLFGQVHVSRDDLVQYFFLGYDPSSTYCRMLPSVSFFFAIGAITFLIGTEMPCYNSVGSSLVK